MDSYKTPARQYAEGIGQAVADRTVNRLKADGTRETWADVAERVARGNALLTSLHYDAEFHPMHHHLRQASILMSGRHLQHGDETQPTRVQEVFTNCSTSAASFVTFYLLLNGSGVGRAYDDGMMAVNWSNMPNVVPVIDYDHQDVANGIITGYLTPRDAAHLYAHDKVTYFKVPDSREGWAEAIQQMETMAHEERKHEVLILDFSDVRPRGAPIMGMQGRPSSGPGPLMSAIVNIARLKNTTMARWRQAMYVDHYLAECVLVGGARRAARMATKDWRDANVFDFIGIKKGNFLWSSNNSVTVDEEFWTMVRTPRDKIVHWSVVDQERWAHANEVFEAVCHHSYHDRTGEPGLINQDRLTAKNEGLTDTVFASGDFVSNRKLAITDAGRRLMAALAGRFAKADYKMITNPCGEITLTKLGGYCVIADVVPFHAQDLADAEDAFRVATRALIRTNLMDCLYRAEVDRTNRIGVGITGFHEFAWKFFGYGFRDIIDEAKSQDFWQTIARFKRAVRDEARDYATKLGVQVPHTDTTIKPAGTTSKLFGLSEGAHLPAMREYLRYVQFRNDDPLVKQYRDLGYPTKDLKSYSGTTIVGFPTVPVIVALGMGDKLVTASEATPEEQYQYLRLMEKYWIVGVEVDGVTPLAESGNQVSYTLKYDPEVVSYEEFKRTLLEGQSSVRCCSVMPKIDTTGYEYQPEQPVTAKEFAKIVKGIKKTNIKEEVAFEHIDCGSGACPIDFNEDELVDADEATPPIMQDKIYVFSTKTCPACKVAKKLLDEAELQYEEINIESAEGFKFLREYTKSKSIPVIVVGDKVFEGVVPLQAWLASRTP
jgi:adenosylcobalamin-dependent ribonucleoside-triphosphate reductase